MKAILSFRKEYNMNHKHEWKSNYYLLTIYPCFPLQFHYINCETSEKGFENKYKYITMLPTYYKTLFQIICFTILKIVLSYY